MIPLREAQQHVLGKVPSLPGRTLDVAAAVGAVLSEPVRSAVAVPPFDNTAVDGFAVRAVDVASVPARLLIAGTIAAGDEPTLAVAPGEAVRIMTGAALPAGADAVVMVEVTTVDGDTVEVAEPVQPGANIRSAGDDIRAGDLVFDAGTRLGPGHVGVLASIGCPTVVAVPPLRVGVLSTGDELVSPGRPLRPGQIYESNRPTLLGLVRQAGHVPVDLGVAPDEEPAIEAAFRRGAAECDAVLSSGGVSMGDFDYVKTVLDRIGDMRWMQIAIRPAKPFAFGLVDGVPVFGLPGNPVSSMVSFELLAKPALRHMQGDPDPLPREVPAVADVALGRQPDGKVHFARVAATMGDDGRYHVRLSGGQGSHMLWAMARADALAVLPDGPGVESGGTVGVLLLPPAVP
jgi:molybdenum cofactor synthesis domain-containing protein